MDWNECKKNIYADIYRNFGKFDKKILLKTILGKNTVSLLFFFRICQYFCQNKKKLCTIVFHPIFYKRFLKLQTLNGIELNQHTKIGKGLRLPHKGSIIIHPKSIIGENCEIMQNVTLGNNFVKDRNGVPIIGNGVIVCAGAKVIGKVTLGDYVIVGANSVVNRDIESKKIVAGVPAKVISNNSYMPINCDYSEER